MLSETFMLYQALERAGRVSPHQHPRVKPFAPSAGPCLRVRLDSGGHVTTVEAVAEQERPGLWTIMEGNQNSFPVVRIKEPLLEVPRDNTVWNQLGFDRQGKRKKSPDTKLRLSVLAQAVKDADLQYSKKCEAAWKRLQDKAGELLTVANDAVEHKALAEFARRFRKAANEPKTLLKSVTVCVLKNAQQARLDALDAVETLLVGKGPPDERGELPQMTVQLAFDLDNEHTFPQRLYSQQMQEQVKRILPAEYDTSGKPTHPAPACAFTGESQSLQVTPFPKVKLPVLNKEFPLVSMFSEAECNKRYGLTDALIVPVSQTAARRMQDALSDIVEAKRKGKTWRGVANGRFEKKKELFDLLIVYVDGKPDIDAHIADLFGTDVRQQQKQFEVDAQAVCKALDGIEREQPGSKLNLFLLRKASEGQAHVVKYLISKNVNIAPIDRWGGTPYSDAKRGNKKEVLEVFENLAVS